MIDRARLATLREDEEARFVTQHPRSAALAEEQRASLLAGVPMPWMTRWPGAFPLSVASAQGGRLVDVDGLEYVDLCLGDTGAMTGHALPAVTEAVAARVAAGATAMLPSADAAWVGAELGRRFGLPFWQLAISATDANRFVLRFARHLTGRPRVAVMDWCYHGTVDEALAVLEARPRRAAAGRPRSAGRRRRHDRGGAVQRPRGAGRAAGPGRRRLPAHGAGTDQHRHRAPVPTATRPRSARSPAGTACCW